MKIVRLDQYVVSRSAIVVRPREPFISWILDTSEEFPRDEQYRKHLENHVTAYLVPEVEVEDAREWLVASAWKVIFKFELYAWSRDKHQWPRRRTRKMFDAWFDVTVVDMVHDLVPGPIEVERW